MAKVGCPVPVEEIMKAAERLPPFPTVIWEVTSLLCRMAPAREIEAVIRYDQAIAAKVLTMSCSAYYARRHAISSLRDATVALGDQQLIQVVMSACVARYFESDLSGYEVGGMRPEEKEYIEKARKSEESFNKEPLPMHRRMFDFTMPVK